MPSDETHSDETHSDETQTYKVLIVEDNDDSRFLIEIILKSTAQLSFARNSFARNVASALAAAEKGRRFDLVLADISLPRAPGSPVVKQVPERNGVDLLRGLRQSAEYEDVPIAAVTAFALPGDQETFLKAGFDAYLSKPFEAQ